jgi:cytochrome P450
VSDIDERDLDALDPFDAEITRDPYRVYELLRDRSPCHRMRQRDVWVVSRYDDVVSVLKNHAVFSSTGGVGPDWVQQPMMPMYDPPQHTRLRRLVSRHFTPKAVKALAPYIEARTDRLLDALLEKGRGDLVKEFAVPLSLGVIADLIGIPKQSMDDFRRWSAGIIEGLAGDLHPDAAARVETLRREFVQYLRELTQQRKARALGSNDIISLLLHAEDEDSLTSSEVIAFCVLLLVAGFETTANGIANAVLALMQNPTQFALLRADPELAAGVVEETVRHNCPVQSFFRNTLQPAEVSGVSIPEGMKVRVLFGSANRDPRHFSQPDAFLITRDAADHIGFGAGIHVCLGAALARLEMNIAISALVRRTRSIAADGDAVIVGSTLFRGISQLPVTLVAS